jgi:hypothetical protein
MDALWVVLREDFIPAPALHELACRFAEDVLPIYGREFPEDNQLRVLLEAKRAWIRGEITNQELTTARSIPWPMARSAALSAAWAARSATWDDASSAAWNAVWDASRSAARYAARYAGADAGYAAMDAAIEKYLEWAIIEIAEKEE